MFLVVVRFPVSKVNYISHYNLLVLYCLIGIVVFMVFLIIYGYYADINSKVVLRSLVKRQQVMNIGLKKTLRPKRVEIREDDDNLSSSRSIRIQPRPQRATAIKPGFRVMKTPSIENSAYFDSQKTYSEKYFHALKNTHIFLNIFYRYDEHLPRPYRVTLYFSRLIAILAVTSLFNTQTHVKIFL
jgi:hypothetical protein